MKATTYPHELIGEEVEIIASTNPSQQGVRGTIIDETKMTLTIRKDGTARKFQKSIITIKCLRTQEIIHGRDLMRRPEERIKG